MKYLLIDIFIYSTAEKYGRKYVKDFATTMRRELGMKVLVLSAHVDVSGTVSYAS
jgi:hypothetical protein